MKRADADPAEQRVKKAARAGGGKEVKEMVEMEKMSPIVAKTLADNEPKAKQLACKISQMLLEAGLTVQSVNAVLNYVWYVIVDTGKVGPANSSDGL